MRVRAVLLQEHVIVPAEAAHCNFIVCEPAVGVNIQFTVPGFTSAELTNCKIDVATAEPSITIRNWPVVLVVLL